MFIHRAGLLLAGTLAVTSCGSSEVRTQDDATAQRLLAAADAAAAANGGKAHRVEVVETTRRNAAEFTGQGSQPQAEKVWVIQVSGDRYVCQSCSRPSGVIGPPPEGRFITVVLRVSDFESTDSGMSDSATDLTRLGEVRMLRDES